jgi:hypothetical protein
MGVSEMPAPAADELTAPVEPFISSTIHVRNIAFTLVSVATVILLLRVDELGGTDFRRPTSSSWCCF